MQESGGLYGERVPEIPAHAQNDHLSWELAPLERIVWVDRHGLLPYQNAGYELRNGTLAQSFVTLDNFYDRGEVSTDGWPWSAPRRRRPVAVPRTDLTARRTSQQISQNIYNSELPAGL